MDERVKTDLSESARIFKDIVWPRIRDSFGGGELEPVEGVTDKEFKEKLDMLAGIDAWHIQNKQGRIRGIASRVQKIKSGQKPFDSFTIRLRRTSGATTEWEKRVKALENPAMGWLFPAITIQAYVEDGTESFLSAAGILTAELFRYVQSTECCSNVCAKENGYCVRANGQDGNEFIVVYWDALQNNGVNVLCVSSQLTTGKGNNPGFQGYKHGESTN